jgi:hypothetical protein
MYAKQEGNVTVGILVAVFFAAWITHIITCLSGQIWGFLIAGAIMFPIGIIHGIGLWFGIF